MIAETVRFPGHKGEIIDGYTARPLGPGPYPGVIVIHEAFGMVEHTRELARKFAAAGYVAVAPNLYSRIGMVDPADMRSVMQAMGGLADSQAIGDLEGAASFFMEQPTGNGKLGCIGHCSGGRHTLLFACNTRSLSAAVDCYGGRVVTDELTPTMPKAVVDMVSGLSCPLLGLFGEADRNPNPEHVTRIEAELKKHRKQYELKSYPAPVGHGFFADYRPSYNQEAAVDGWSRIFTFYSKHLA
jgi:carboxymethylenebutenolidase